jgi:hypothetical protein
VNPGHEALCAFRVASQEILFCFLNCEFCAFFDCAAKAMTRDTRATTGDDEPVSNRPISSEQDPHEITELITEVELLQFGEGISARQQNNDRCCAFASRRRLKRQRNTAHDSTFAPIMGVNDRDDHDQSSLVQNFQ